MLLSDTVQSLLNNEKQLSLAAINALLKILNNILNHPNEEKYRRINLSSVVVEKYILPAVGALELLFLIGFEEGDDKLILPLASSLDNVLLYKNELEMLKRERFSSNVSTQLKEASSSSKSIQDQNISTQLLVGEPDMKRELISRFQSVLQFESPSLQEKARNVIPLQDLNKKAMERVAAQIEDNLTSPDQQSLDFQDFLLLELMSWFKDDYFSWFDQGWCDTCQKNMKFASYATPTQEDISRGASRVELHQCEICGKEERFPRLINPGELMKTKKGRCMEWAACFTFFCRSLGLDSRYVVDDTDHVWTEVFSKSQDRWIHADSCENKADSPLIYEKGWGKKLSYIFAYSRDEIVDCVWRYSLNHKEVCSRRRRCREDWLASTIFSLNKQNQSLFSPEKKKFLEHRLVKEIVEFFNTPRKLKEGENEGRSSGSLAWRMGRGEVSSASTSFSFRLSDEELNKKEMIVKYSAAKDVYIRPINNVELKGWQNGTYSVKDIFRKQERDWKLVYLARNEGCIGGTIAWKFDWSNQEPLKIKSVLIVLQHKTFENGVVQWQLCSGDMCFPGNESGILELSADEFEGNITKLELSVELSSGKGDVAWQHAQLFRQGEKDKEFPFFVDIKFE